MTQINAYIGFNGDCRKAMEFYRDCIGGELSVQTMAESPMAGECAPGMKNSIVHAALIKGPLTLMGTDMIGPDGYIRGNNVALCLNCRSEEEINSFYLKLSAGGKILQPLDRSFWGDLFSCFTDKFGITWMLNYHEEQ
ncbi:MAG TPA: VOC family protein [Mucilaginibacter sp.]|jgi:PhnB protein|nr:VOC family protein [Mucilaginibacter sp.]